MLDLNLPSSSVFLKDAFALSNPPGEKVISASCFCENGVLCMPFFRLKLVSLRPENVMCRYFPPTSLRTDDTSSFFTVIDSDPFLNRP